jgi:exosortase/archaeosortase family protein
MQKRELSNMFFRYALLIILALGNLALFYKVFTPLTVQPTFIVLESLYNAVLLEGNVIFFKGFYVEIIPACVAGAAYYFLTILNLTTPMNISKRIKSLAFLAISFLILNTLRIIIFAMLLFKGYQYFDLTHNLTWYFGSTILVVIIWFVNVYKFKIENIPVYTDLGNLIKGIKK